jgi:hypothetical protein
MFMKQLPTISVSDPFNMTLDYCLTLEQMITAGNYGYANQSITAQEFPLTGKGKVEAEVILVHFNRVVMSDEAVKEMLDMGLNPGKIEHLLALGAEHPNLQKQFPIIYLGSSSHKPNGERTVPCLGYWDNERVLSLDWCDRGWIDRCRFIGIRQL